MTYYTRLEPSGRVIGPSQRLPPDSKQHSQATDSHAAGEVRTRSPSKGRHLYARATKYILVWYFVYRKVQIAKGLYSVEVVVLTLVVGGP